METLRKELQIKGFVRIPPSVFCLNEISIAELRDEMGKLFAGRFETGVYPDEIHWREGISRENVTREICNGWKASSKIQKLVCGEDLGLLACSLMGWGSSRIGQDDVIHKPPMSTAVGFHQDGSYISDNFVPRENNCLTMWIALDDADIENGALQYAPGSHLWGKDRDVDVAASSFHLGDNDDHFAPLRRAAQLARVDPEKAVCSVQTVAVAAGEMVVHLQQVWHGSGPNMSTNRRRRALVAHLIDGKVKWRPEPRPHYIYGRYWIRGERNLRQDFFPITSSISDDMVRTSWLD